MAGTPTPAEEGASVPSPPDGYRNLPVSAPQPRLDVPALPDPSGASGGGLLVVDADFLARAARAAHEAADAANGTARSLSGAVHRSGPSPWGDDPGVGRAFGEVFAGPREDLRETVRRLPSLLEDLADTLDATRRTFLRSEDRARTTAEGLRRTTDAGSQSW